MNKLNYTFHQLIDRISILSVLNWMLLLAIVWVGWGLLVPANQQLTALKQQQPDVKQSIQTPERQTQFAEQQFLQEIPQVEEVSHAVNSLFSIAQAQGLVIHEVHYKDEAKAGEPVLRYNIDFNLLGDYLTIKQFISDLLVAEPYLALQQISFTRDDVGRNDINAQFKMSLFIQ